MLATKLFLAFLALVLCAAEACGAIALTLNPSTGALTVTRAAPIKVGSQVPVTLTFTSDPGDVTAVQFALGRANALPAAVLAFTEDFSDAGLVWSATLDCTDERLLAYMAGKPETQLAFELSTTIDGSHVIYPDQKISVQPAIVTGPTMSEGGPSYLTAAQVAAGFLPTGSIVVHKPDGSAASYATLALAKAAAASGELIEVGPGTYAITASLAKDGVAWEFRGNGSVTMTGNTAEAIWDDGAAAMGCTVLAPGFDFVRTGGVAVLDTYGIRLRHAGSNFNIVCRDFSVTNATGNGSIAVLKQEAGRVILKGRVFDARALTGFINGYCLWWQNGSGEVHAARVTSDYVTVWSDCNAAPTGDFHVFAAEILNAVFASGMNSDAACWVHFDILKDVTPGGGGGAFTGGNVLDDAHGNKIYLTGQKIFGYLHTSSFGGLLYVDIQKHEAVNNGAEDEVGSFFSWNLGTTGTGTCFYRADHWDQKAFTGQVIQIDAGIVEMSVGRFVGNANSGGILLKGGELRFKGRLDFHLNGGTNPVILKGVTTPPSIKGTLISQGSTKSIARADSGTYTVDAWGGYANNGVGAGVTANGLVADPTVQ